MPQHQRRTTLQLDDDVLAAARVLARQQRTSLEAVISELARQAGAWWHQHQAPAWNT